MIIGISRSARLTKLTCEVPGRTASCESGRPAGVTEDAAAKQPEHLHRVFGPYQIGISDDQQGGRRDRTEGLRRNVSDLLIHLGLLGEQPGEVLWARRNPQVFLVPRRAVHHLRAHFAQPLHQAGVDALEGVGNRREDELAHGLRMPDDQLEGHYGTRAVAEDVGGSEPQLLYPGGDIVRQPFDGQWAIDVRGVPVPLQLEADDLPVLG